MKGEPMGWTHKQKALAMQACKHAGISEEQRVDVSLRQFDRAHYKGDITSTSPRLNQADYEVLMAIVEGMSPGGRILRFAKGYWGAKAADWLQRVRHRALRIAGALERAGILAGDGAGLSGWILHRVTNERTGKLEELNFHELQALMFGLSSFTTKHHVDVNAEAPGDAVAAGAIEE
jgi:hypothetical protein